MYLHFLLSCLSLLAVAPWQRTIVCNSQLFTQYRSSVVHGINSLIKSNRVFWSIEIPAFQRFVCKLTEIIIQSAYNLCWNLESPLLSLCSQWMSVVETTNMVTIFALKYLLQITLKKYCKQRRCAFSKYALWILAQSTKSLCRKTHLNIHTMSYILTSKSFAKRSKSLQERMRRTRKHFTAVRILVGLNLVPRATPLSWCSHCIP